MTASGSSSPQPPPAVPSGTVTFLFTDIEGSTKLLERLREQYAVVLADQRELLRAAFARYDGHEIDTQGDSFFVAFPRAIDAVACAIDAQRALAAHAWPQSVSVRVRMGLHTGEPMLGRTGYVGLDVHRAARIAAAGHGGQVLLSQSTRDLVYQDLPAGAALRDLGSHQLKDIRFAQTLFQLDIDGLPVDFPALKTLTTGDEPPAPGEPPYLGLLYFEEHDRGRFFGREAAAARLVDRLHSTRFLALIGASGSGKSSLVRAAVVPALKRGGRGVHWHVHLLTPTARPLEALATSLSRGATSLAAVASLLDDLRRDTRSLHLWAHRHLALEQLGGHAAAARRLLIVVDQFEELFTLCRDAGERQQFVDNLLTAAQSDGGGATVLLTLRADFYEHLAAFPALAEAVAHQQEYLGAMSAAELRQAIEGPALQAGWAFSPGLVDLMLHDVGAVEGRQPEPGALPLLSHALLETWQRRRGHLMNLKAYTEAGGVRGAIARTAEGVFQDELSPEQQQIARGIFLRLTELGEGTQDTRRRARLDELLPAAHGSPELVSAVVERLAAARLITTEAGTVEVAHEALIREWPTLREWLNADREGLRLHRHLTDAAQSWLALERDEGELYRGARLAQTLEWAAANDGLLNGLEREFLEAAQDRAARDQAAREAQRQRELETARRLAQAEARRAEEQAHAARRLLVRNRLITAIGVAALLLAALAGLFAFQSSDNAARAGRNLVTAEAASTQAVAQAAAAQAANTEAVAQAATAEAAEAVANTQRNAALAAQATSAADRALAEEAAVQALSRELAVQAELNLAVDPERSLLLALAALEQAETIPAVNALHKAVKASRVRHRWAGDGGPMYGVSFNPDGSLLAVAGADRLVRLLDPATGRELRRFAGHAETVTPLSFSPDGQRLASLDISGVLKLWDVASGHELRSVQISENQWDLDELYLAMRFSGDGRWLATVWGRIARGNVGSGSELRFWDPVTGDALAAPVDFQASRPDLFVIHLEFSPDGRYAAIAWAAPDDTGEGVIEVWDLAESRLVSTLAEAFIPASEGLTFSPDGTRLVTNYSLDGRATVWDAATGQKLLSLNQEANMLVFSPDGRRLLASLSGGLVKAYDAASGAELFTLAGHVGVVQFIAVSPECQQPPDFAFEWCGRWLATAGADGTIRLWDVSPAGDAEWLNLPGDYFTLSRDRTRIIIGLSPDFSSAGYDANYHAWDLPAWSGVPARPVEATGYTSHTVPIAPGAVDQGVWVWSALYQVTRQAGLQLFDFTDYGRLLFECCPLDAGIFKAFARQEPMRVFFADPATGRVEVFDTQAQAVVHSFPLPLFEDLFWMHVTPTGDTLAFTMQDKSVQIWDVASGQYRYTLDPIYLEDYRWPTNWFSPDGRWLVQSNCAGLAEVREVATGELRYALHGHTACVSGFALSADSRLLAVNSFRGPTRVWDFETGQALFELPSGGNVMAFSPDGSRLLVNDYDETALVAGTVRQFLVRLPDLVAVARSRLTRGFTTEECRQYLRLEACPAQ